MKQALNSASRCNGRSIASSQSFFSITKPALFLLFFAGLFLTSCKKEAAIQEEAPVAAKAEESNVVNQYQGLSFQTKWELQQARAATARYRNINNAIADGYVDINVVVPQMGFHYMKATLADANFDMKNPEILVYNMDEDGKVDLVAVEYAVPISLTPNNAPQGFAGNADVWDRNTGFGLWLLHAWVWSYNPNGVFNPTNPLVHLH